MMTEKAALTCLRVIAFDEREPKYSIDIHVYIIIIYIYNVPGSYVPVWVLRVYKCPCRYL